MNKIYRIINFSIILFIKKNIILAFFFFEIIILYFKYINYNYNQNYF